LIQPNGAVVVGGNYFHPDVDWAIVRFTPAGGLDHSFSGDGKLTTVIGPGFDFLAGLVRQATGDIVAGGWMAGAPNEVALGRAHEAGSKDTGFGAAGTATSDLGDDPSPRAIAKAPHHKIVVGVTIAGPSSQDLGAARFLAGS